MLRRFSVFSLAFLLCLSLFPARALADVGNASVLWSGSVNDGTQFGAFVKGGTRFDAAAASLGYDSSRFSDEVKAKLTDPDYGGMFYTFANAFSSVSSPIEIPSWVPAFVTTSSVIADLLNNISGENYPHWSVAVAYSVYDLALRDLLVVLNGGGSGGGSGGNVNVSQCYECVCANLSNSNMGDTYFYARAATIDSDGNVVPGSGQISYSCYMNSYHVDSVRVYVPASMYNFLVRDWSGKNCSFVLDFPQVKAFTARVGFCVSDSPITVSRELVYTDTYVDALHLSGNSYYYAQSGVNAYYDSEGVFFVLHDANVSLSSISGIKAFGFHSVPFVVPTYVAPPSGTWPDPVTPVAPTAPELPEPAEPVVETPVTPTVPAPVWPDITINIEPDPVPGTTPSGLDYTELLTRINNNLISIDSFARAINSNLNSLRSDLLAEFNGVIGSLRNIYNYLLTIDSVLETHCTHLRNKIEESAVFIANYMRTLIKWLADQLDFDDLTNVEAPDNSLLTTINEKLGGGTYEPNPIKDESAYYQWLDDLWDRFLLGDNWQSSMGSISGSFSELKTRFPFSVPWDIVALFRLFVHDPVTPVFDLPLYFSPDGSTPVHVDLSPWDSVASLVRPMVFVIFALKLALLSRDLLGGLGADKGGL